MVRSTLVLDTSWNSNRVALGTTQDSSSNGIHIGEHLELVLDGVAFDLSISSRSTFNKCRVSLMPTVPR